MADVLPLSDDFPTADEADWKRLVEKALKGRSTDSLDSTTEHGVPVRALYREGDWRSSADASGFPGAGPFVRGGSPQRDEWLPWDIRQIVRHPDPSVARQEIMEALHHGVSSIELRVDGGAEQGVCVRTAQELARLLDEVDMSLATIAIEAVGDSAAHGRELAAMLATAIDSTKRQGAVVAFNIDPIGAMARTGSLNGDAGDILAETGDAAAALTGEFSAGSCLRVDTRPVHEAGGTEVQELAYLAATGAAYMRAAIGAGLSPTEASRSLLFTVSIGADYHVELAKLRAVRRVWARIAEAFGADGAMRLQCVTSRRMLARRDPWSNLLRNTAACFAAGVGGADIVTVRTFTDAMGHPGSLARRLARNTQIIAQEESGLGRVSDPVGGAWAFERLGEDIAQAAWGLFQEIEKQGGIIASLQEGGFQRGVADARAARRAAAARREEWITGVNDFPALDEDLPDCLEVDSAAILSAAVEVGSVEISDRRFSGLCAGAAAGATAEDLSSPEQEGGDCDPLWPIRMAEPYEALRDIADARREHGAASKILLVALGPLAEHSARLTYAANFFGAGGIEANTAMVSEVDIAGEFSRSGCSLVCICGSDGRYAAEAEDVAGALRQAGAGRIYLAGRPGESEAALRKAGVDEFIHVGVDVIASLELAYAELGIASERSNSH